MRASRRRLVFLAAAGLTLGFAATSESSAISLQYHTQTGDADYYVSGGNADLLGSAFAAGRFDGDNRSDFVVCSAANNSCWLFYGVPGAGGGSSMGEPDIIYWGPGGGFGSTVSFLGDLNGDGAEDFGVGAPNHVGETGVLQGGSFWIFFGRKDGFTGSVGYYDAATTIFGAQTGDNLGTAAAGAGDVDRDGYGDFWVSAPNASEGGSRVGEVLLFRGRASFPTELYRANASARYFGAVPAGEFGRVVLGAVDLDGDGRVDLATSTNRYRDGSGSAVGAAFAFLSPLATNGAQMNASQATITYWGDSLAPSLGTSLSFAPNFTKEKGRFLLIGAPTYLNGTSSGGSLHVFMVNATACCRVLHRWDAVGLMYTIEPNDQTGATAASFGDIDKDGRQDMVLGAPLAEVGNKTDAGRVYIIYGNDTTRQPLLVDKDHEGFEGKSARSQLGSLLALADFNGDGWTDIFMGAPGDSKGINQDGMVYLFLGRPRNRAPVVNLSFDGNFTEGGVMNALANISDADGDRLSWSWGGSPDGDDHPGESMVEMVFPDEGYYRITIVVLDGTLYGSDEETLLIANVAPWCNVTIDRNFIEGTPGTLRAKAGDNGSLDKWNVNWTGPSTLMPNGLSAVYEPTRGKPFNVSFRVQDEDGGVSWCNLTVEVTNVPPSVTILGPGILSEGSQGLYSAEVIDPGIEDAFFLNWTSGVGVANTSAYVFKPNTPGNHVLQVRVSDLDGGESFASFTVRVNSVQPDCAILGPSQATEGDSVVFEIRQYTGAEFDTITVSWDSANLTATRDGLYLRILRAPTGVFKITALVTDDDFDYVRFTATLAVENREPLEGIRARPPGPYHDGQQVTLDAMVGSWETTPTVRIQYVWTLDGVKFSIQRSTSFQAITGKHQIQVTATDDQGATSEFFLRIDVIGQPPVVTLDGPSQLLPGSIGTWRAQASDSSGSVVNLTWDVDGIPVTEGPELKWSTPSQGTHVVRVTARDASGEVTVETMLVSVSPPPDNPAGISFGWIAVPIGAAAAFAAGILLGAYVIGRIRNRKPDD